MKNPISELQKFFISLAICLIVIAIVYFVTVRWIESVKETARQEVRQQHAAEIAKLKADALKVEATLRGQLIEAQNNANVREQTIRSLASAASSSSAGLRDALGRVRSDVHGASAEANAQRAITLAELLGSCQERYRQLAEKADRHVNDLRTHREAWPVVPAQAPR